MEFMLKPGLKGVSKEVLQSALDKVKAAAPSREWELELLTNDIQDAAVEFMRDYFVPHEPLVRAFGVEWDMDTNKYWREVFKQGMTLVLTDKRDRTIIAVRGLEVVNKNDKIDTEHISDGRLRNLLVYINYCDDHAKFFEHYDCEVAIHFSELAVHEAYRKKGIATFMLKSAVEFVKYLQIGLEHVCIKGEASSNYSKRVYEKMGFDLLFEQKYEEYKQNGERVMHNIKEHKSNIIYDKRVQVSCKDGDIC